MIRRTYEIHETNSQKPTNISTHQLTETELATWNPGFSVDLLDAERRHLYNNSNQGVFNFQIPSYLHFIDDISFKHSIFHIYLNFSMNALKSNICWSCLHKVIHTMLNNCLVCASNIWYSHHRNSFFHTTDLNSKQTILIQVQGLFHLIPQPINKLFLEDAI